MTYVDSILWHQEVLMTSKGIMSSKSMASIHYDIKKYVMSYKRWHKVQHDVKNYVMALKGINVCHGVKKYIMISKSMQNASWSQIVCLDVKTYVATSKSTSWVWHITVNLYSLTWKLPFYINVYQYCWYSTQD